MPAFVSMPIAFEVPIKMKVQMLKVMQMDIFLQHILCIDYCCYLEVMDELSVYVVEVGERGECYAVAEVLDDSDADFDNFAGVASIFVAANAVVSAVDSN